MATKPKLVTDQQFKIIKGAPIPPRRGGRGESMYPFAAMEVGDAFDVPMSGPKNKWGQHPEQARISRAADMWAKRHAPGKRFTIRKLDDSVCRIWRVA